LENSFLAQGVMDAFEMKYTQYWSKWIAKETFLAHMALLILFFCQSKKLGSNHTCL
jgi:hypothetical protein